MSKKILFISSSIFPKGAAYSSRIKNFGRLFNVCGYDVHVISDSTLDMFESSRDIKKFENCTYQTVTGKPTSFKRFTNGKHSLKLVEKYLDNNKVDCVITNASYDRFTHLFDLCNKKNIPLVLEICEWFDVSSFKFGKRNPFYRKFVNCIENEFHKANQFLPISSLLENYFEQFDKKTLRIPTILDTQLLPFSEKTNNDKIRIIFAGSLGGSKESFINILYALEKLGKDRYLFEFNIFGISRKKFLKSIGTNRKVFEKIKECIKIKGRIPQDQVHQEYINSDFSIFIRPNRQSSHAGFPTKLAESMAAGTPVICNNTGDISLYLENGKQGYLLQNGSIEELVDVFRKILNSTSEQRGFLRVNARRMAEEKFDFRNYIEKMQTFLKF